MTPELAIAREEYGYGGIYGVGVTFDRQLVSVKNLSELNITSKTRIIANPAVDGAFSAPWKVYFDPTKICGLWCHFCLSAVPNIRESKIRIPSLSLPNLEKINEQIKDAGVLAAKIGGGEPFTYPGFWPTIEYLGLAGMALSTSTSGTTLNNERLLPDDKINLLATHGVRVSISVDGRPDYHDAIRGEIGLLEKALGPGMKRLVDGGVRRIELRPTLTNTKESMNQLAYLDELSQELKLKMRIRLARPYGSASADINGVGIVSPTSDVLSLLRELRSRAKNNPLLNIDGFLNFDKEPEVETGLDCGAGTRNMGIGAKGEAVPCGAISAFFSDSHDLLNGQNLLEVWQNGIAFTKVREYFIQENANSSCRNCGFVDACQGGCPSVRLSVGAAKNPLCPRDLNL